ncbi:ATP-binding response regulator [Xanthomonas maliensis]|uniref:ATP-binding response regulator n=2 Tax=Xanthomonas maliensis TaxID=1321368 RepID=UPI0012646FD1|nr:ATP-binding protein [Xanthomonas maliensis]KAB7772548.1 hybrid sensor histidine kinase/response regulator [Xanthomonas maliensis]
MAGNTEQFEAPGLILAAKQLKNDRLVKIFESFLEYRACVGRVLIQLIVTVWSGAWMYGPQPVLLKEAVTVFPWTVAFLVASVVWMVLVRRRIVPAADWLDGAGFVMNLLLIGIQTYFSFILLIWLNAFLPFITIAAVARYGRKAIKPALIGIVLVLLFTAPKGYWLSRPAYFVHAVALTVILPLMVARMLLAMQEIAFQALASRESQSRFISTMSHELRTPLNAIINCAQLIDAGALRKEQRDLMQMVSANASALRHRVDAVLDVASIDGNRLLLADRPLDLMDVMRTVQAICANAASAKGVAIEFHVDADAPVCLMGDEGRIEQVITNLVTNAIKFTPAGGQVALTIAAQRAEARWEIAVTVADSGIGIPADKKEAIFAPFQQVSTGSSRTEGGVGLGLYIARSVSDAMQGSLSVDDNPSGGSIFRWRFSAAAASDGSRTAQGLREALEEHRHTVPSLHCLVFEDMETNRVVIDNLLSHAGHRVSFHADGDAALQRIREAAPDLVFMDLHMPGKSGWDALHEVAKAADSLPPIVVLTADTRSDSIRDAAAVGVAGYLAKPINAYELLAIVQQHAQRRHPNA